jgi:hypothetical protein
MLKLKIFLSIFFISAFCVNIIAQTKEAYNNDDAKKEGLLNPSRFSIQHSLNFGMGTSSGSSMQSQGLYSTLLSYKFSKPLTLNLNFGFPLFSSFSPNGNLNQQNLTSLEYFKNMPIDVALSWKPSSNLSLQLNIVRNPQYDYYSGMTGRSYFRSLYQ